jgi:peptide chain release factor 3
MGLDDPAITSRIDADVYRQGRDELEMLEGAGAEFDRDRVLAGEITPVYFGSAANNFGVELLLDGFLEHSADPGPRRSGDRIVEPKDPVFSGFVFKIQANMDPKHRDRIAFIRVVSGRFEREMSVVHVQSGKKIRLSSAQKLFGQERETVEEGEAGDVIGIIGHDILQIGDTLAEDRTIRFSEIPQFTPEVFAYLTNPQPGNSKKYRLGVDQLLKEGVVQQMEIGTGQVKTPILAAVGPLQFEVVQYRLKSEYGAESRLEKARWQHVRWWRRNGSPEGWMPDLLSDSTHGVDAAGRAVIFFSDEWSIRNFQKRLPDVEISTLPFDANAG